MDGIMEQRNPNRIIKKEAISLVIAIIGICYDIIHRSFYTDELRHIFNKVQFYFVFPLMIIGFFYSVVVLIMNIKRQNKKILSYLLISPMIIIGLIGVVILIVAFVKSKQ